MKQRLFAACLAGTLAFAGTASADGLSIPGLGDPVGKQAGTFMVRLRGIGLLPEDIGSSVTGIGGRVSASNTAVPELDFSYFMTDHLALELIAATSRHSIKATGTTLGTVDVGKVWVLPPTLTVQYHFMPHEAFSPYVGAGLNATFFYGAKAAGGAVTSVGFSNAVGGVLQAGFDYNFTGHWFANFDVKQIFVSTTARIDGGAIRAKTGLDPTVIGTGIGYRF
ncbi:MAG: OmpW family outer membrane protein [Acetobacteraceae bacterium]